ncbi:hypothetical protein [Thermomonospora umbrina]|uniref:Uncharacterized protein n=1 Tax=Thermomonospora umbrina TaxID=111806 RepID=A0A3D9T5P3_9ACTN|nr:hypothetical protein [Thermomonospora umbrina]REF00025.1 hypothetical protein DFJ69_5545 [Thermomonospora umbrina]
MLLDAAPPLPRSMRAVGHLSRDDDTWSATDTVMVALSLFTVWAARTGRTLRDVPVGDLTAHELEEFWIDDRFEGDHTAPTGGPS